MRKGINKEKYQAAIDRTRVRNAEKVIRQNELQDELKKRLEIKANTKRLPRDYEATRKAIEKAKEVEKRAKNYSCNTSNRDRVRLF